MNKARMNVAALSLSAAAFVGILTREGYTDRAIIPTKGDVPTLGFGTTGGVRMGDVTTPVVAAQRALADSQQFEGALRQCVTAPLHQVEYDVYVDLSYNIGASAFCRSTIVRRLNAGDYRAACDAILLFRYAAGFDCSTPGNGRCAGLWADRKRKHAQCMGAQ
ncbi:lysozyme [Pseudoduganella albidiflava]|uniref:Lysozyme n=1 Tax=Pseudoduganella albidiflava TaxID=321983 RepID=A0A411X2Q3_9BURK|nr:lysozyme [Pseudoduganella albidiflava]QBI03281.1 lysozyme [Pseudoduganella albidiflava]GGY68124.1 lysozyme [Pseudoduganella albidiflava]